MRRKEEYAGKKIDVMDVQGRGRKGRKTQVWIDSITYVLRMM